LPSLVDDNVQSAMAAPVREHGRPIGSLVVATHREGRTYTSDEREILLAFSEHASIAITDARTVRAMEHQAFHDALTGLPNRALFVDRLGQALKRSRQDVGSQCAVLFIDLDRFKMVNDSLGHAAGDELLVEIARRLTTSIRDSDTAARLGGDEFAVVTESVSGPAEALAMAARLRAGLNSPIRVGGKEMLVSATVGVAVAETNQDADELLRNADLAMYDAKGRGEEGFALYQKSMHAAAIARLDLESSLRRAIELEQFEVYYQPVVELGRNEIRGVEALLRWNHPQRGILGPAEFIPVAEDTGLILRLGSWALATAMGQARRWTDALGDGASLSLSVNLSARQLQRAEIVEEVRNALTASGLNPAALTLEITETVLMLDTQTTLERLTQIKALGVKLAIDDFGTGYSSLGYLRRFPIDCLKIDRSFVKDLGEGPEQSAVASAIMALGHALHLTVIAEGIEEPRQVRELQQIGCEQGQGYLFSPPVPAADLEALLLRRRGTRKLTVVA
jgi:diguanylate cyclase (GGDEF)-like protein